MSRGDYWAVFRNGIIWTDWIETESEAYDHIDECIADGFDGDYEVKQMEEEDENELGRLFNDTY